MSAADNTSKGQFGWIEDTTIHHTSAKNDYSPETTVGYTALTRAAVHEAGDDGYAPQEARVTANWSSVSPHLYSADDIETGRHLEGAPNRSSWSDPSVETVRQGKLFNPGRESPPKVDFMESTEKSRFSTMGGLGALANIVEGHTGKTIKPSTDLSPHSAPLVSRITGTEHRVTNDMDFVEPEDREEIELPRREIWDEKTRSDRYGGTTETTHTNRWVPREEIDAGKKKLTGHMRSMKGPKVAPDPNTYTQGQMFPEPEGDSAEMARLGHDQKVNSDARVERLHRRHAERLAARGYE